MGGALTADLIVEVAWGDTWKTAAPTWVDITTYVQSLSCRRGRDQELDRFEAGTMTMTLDNRDRRFEPEFTGGAYSPDVLPGAPVRVQALHSVTTYDVWQGFIESYSLTYPGAATDAVVRVDCVDGFKYLAQSKLEIYRQMVRDDFPLAFWLMDEAQGSVLVDSSPLAGLDAVFAHSQGFTWVGSGGKYGGPYIDGDSTAIASVTNDAGLLLTGSWTFEAWLNNDGRSWAGGESPRYLAGCNDPSTSGAGTPWVVYLAESTGAADLVAIGGIDIITFRDFFADAESGWAHVVVSQDATAQIIRCWKDGVEQFADSLGNWSAPTLTSSDRFYLWDIDQTATPNAGGYGDLMSHAAVYDYAIDEERVAAHANAAFDVWVSETADTRIGSVLDDLAWPAGARDIDTGTVTLASTTVEQQTYLATLREIERSEDGYLYMGTNGDVVFKNRQHRTLNQNVSNGTFGPGSGDLPIFIEALQFDFDDSVIFNDVRVGPRDRSTVRVEDATSQTAYGQRTLTRNNLHISSGASLTDLANAYLYRYKDPRLRLDALTIKPEKQPANLYPQILVRDIGDRITVQLEPPGGGAEIDQDVFIEAIEHELEVDDWTTTWQVTPTAPSEFWILGTGTLGTTTGVLNTRLGY